MTQRMVDRHVCVSQSVARFSASVARLRADKLVVIPNGIDIARFRAVEPAELASFGISGRRVVTFVGRLDAQKGIAQLLKTAIDWLRRLPDCDLLLVGKGPLEGVLQQQCRDLGIAQRVHFAGWRADISAILAASSLLVLTSAWEGMPNVVLEAMACGLPVACTQVEGVDELLGSAAAEQSVPYGAWDAFSSMVVRILTDARLADRLGRDNRQRAEHTFRIERMVSAYQDLWEQILASPALVFRNSFSVLTASAPSPQVLWPHEGRAIVRTEHLPGPKNLLDVQEILVILGFLWEHRGELW